MVPDLDQGSIRSVGRGRRPRSFDHGHFGKTTTVGSIFVLVMDIFAMFADLPNPGLLGFGAPWLLD